MIGTLSLNGQPYIQFIEELFRTVQKNTNYQLTPERTQAYILTDYKQVGNNFVPNLQYIGEIIFTRMQMAGPASVDYSSNPFQGYWEYNFIRNPGNYGIFIPDPGNRIANAIQNVVNMNGLDNGCNCSISGGKQKSKKSKKSRKSRKGRRSRISKH